MLKRPRATVSVFEDAGSHVSTEGVLLKICFNLTSRLENRNRLLHASAGYEAVTRSC